MTNLDLPAPARTVGLVINAPMIFAREDFMEWLNDSSEQQFTWHDRVSPTAHEYSDTIVLIDSHYDGSASSMPEDIWKALCDIAYSQYGGPDLSQAHGYTVHVRLTNLAE